MKYETEAQLHAAFALVMLVMTVFIYWLEFPRAAVVSAAGFGWSTAIVFMLVVRKMPPRQQLARILAALCAAHPAPVTLKIRHEELAELVGVSRMTIGTLLTGLEADGLLTRGYRRLVVTQPEALRHMSQL